MQRALTRCAARDIQPHSRTAHREPPPRRLRTTRATPPPAHASQALVLLRGRLEHALAQQAHALLLRGAKLGDREPARRALHARAAAAVAAVVLARHVGVGAVERQLALLARGHEAVGRPGGRLRDAVEQQLLQRPSVDAARLHRVEWREAVLIRQADRGAEADQLLGELDGATKRGDVEGGVARLELSGVKGEVRLREVVQDARRRQRGWLGLAGGCGVLARIRGVCR
mmetsp:Transcript_46600/g.129515  ORF Transcript_46600/g.129515 Transcript_46600/m.129515 type:complete len:229 (-) Transcript_46600:1550-2236(-)